MPTATPTGPADNVIPPVGSSGRRIASLDGVRGIAVLLVLLFHVELGPFGGGFVGVTVFFTLSGYLIATRSLAEVSRTGSFSLAGFIERRVRRLAPASFLCIAGTVLATWWLGTSGQLAQLRGDVIGAVANVANWRFLADGTSYADLFAGPSPLNHYWSLAIEEQFYVVFPIAAVLLVRLRRGRRATATVALVAATSVASLLLAWHAGTDRFYYGTDTRMFELLVGVGLALALRPAGTHSAERRVDRRPGRWALDVAGLLGLGAIVAAAMTFDNGARSFARGGAQGVGVATAVLLWALLGNAPVMTALCSIRPLVWVGKVSYGVYLYHWPIVALCPRNVGPLHGWSLALAQIGVSLAVAGVSWRFVERHVTSRRLLPVRRRLGVSWAAVAVVMVAASVAVTATASDVQASPALLGGGKGLAAVGETPSTTPHGDGADPDGGAGTVGDAGPGPLRVAVAGDSTATVFAKALTRYADSHPDELAVVDLSMPGCTITRVATIRHFRGESGQDMSNCALWPLALGPRVEQFRPDVSVVFLAMMEQADQRESAGGPWHNVLQPAWAAHQLGEFDLLATGLHLTGAPSLWADVPYMKFQPNRPWISDDDRRTDALNRVLRELDARRGDVSMIDLAGRLNRPGRRVDTDLRPDGIHLTDEAADRLVTRWLVPLLHQRVTQEHP